MATRSAVSPARRAAFTVLLRVFEDDAYADRAFATAAAGLDARDRALAQRLAYGTVQRVRTLDHAIERIGRRRVDKLDVPVRASLRLGAYQLGYLDSVPRHAAVNESVELVRAARLERAVPFTNAVMRRLSLGLDDLLASLPEGPLKHSYPDWIWDVWRRDLGEEEALALMRAQNEPPETVVRLVRGEIDGQPTDVPGAWRVERVDQGAFAEGRIWPQSRGSQLAGLAVGSQEGERVLDLCAAPGGKTTMLRGEVVAVELHEGRARELEENARRLGATNVRVVNADGLALPEALRGFDRALVDAPCSGLGVLAARPDLRWRGEPLPELQLALLRAAAERVRPGGTVVYAVCTINADENEAVVDTAGLEPEHLGGEWPAFAHPRRPEFLLTTPHRHGTSGFFVARLRVPAGAGSARPAGSSRRSDRPGGVRSRGRVPWNDWIRTVEIEPSLYAADFSRLGEQIDILLRSGARIFHFDVGDGHFVPPVTIGPIVLRSISGRIHEAGGAIDCHLMVDNPVHHFDQIAEAGGDSVTFHVEAAHDPAAVIRAARERALQVGVAFNPETAPETAAAAAAGADLVLCMSIHPGYSGQAFMPGALDRVRLLRQLVPQEMHVQVDGGVGLDNVRQLHEAGADLLVAGTAIFGHDDLSRAYRGLVQALA